MLKTCKFQLFRVVCTDQILNIFDSLKSRVNLNGKVLMGAYVTPKELSLVAGLPQEEVVGIELKEQVTFGLNPPKVSVVDSLNLGSLVQDGRILKHKKVDLKTGVISTCMYLLLV